MKKVSFEVAKAIKDAGYPQDKSNSNNQYYYTKGGQLSDLYYYGVPYYDVDCFAPTYLDVWLWVWREKGIKIALSLPADSVLAVMVDNNNYTHSTIRKDPEEVIIAAIEYLVDNNLIS